MRPKARFLTAFPLPLPKQCPIDSASHPTFSRGDEQLRSSEFSLNASGLSTIINIIRKKWEMYLQFTSVLTGSSTLGSMSLSKSEIILDGQSTIPGIGLQ